MSAQSAVSAANNSEALFGDLRDNWGWLFGLGVFFLILGFIGLGRLFTLSVAGTLFFGILIIVGGIAQLVEALKCKGWKGVAYHVLIAVLYIVGGFFVIQEPLAAKLLLTWILGAVLVFVGIVRGAMAFQMRSSGGWFVPLLGAIISIILGAVILVQWPLSGLFVIGLFIAVELITNGWSYIFIALAARKASKTAAA
ncbi:MAG: DUF308 domain-containing protein [Pseudomonadota bacterium]